MFRLFITLCAIAMASTAGHAVAETDRFDRDDLYEAIQAGNHRVVESAFAELRKEQQHKQRSADDLRNLFAVFSTSNPDIMTFAEGWLDAYPDSAFAQAGLAWAHIRTGWDIRGDKLARDVYPYALEEFHRLHETAWQHAWTAYEIDPGLVPASDALISLANSTGRKKQAYEVLYEVMNDHPDMGTLTRAIGMTIPGWGGTWEQAEELCDYYAPMIEWQPSDPVVHCKVYAALSFHSQSEGYDWARAKLASGALPELDHMRVFHATGYEASRADAVFAYDYLTAEGITDYDNARRFDERIAIKYGFDFISEAHLRRAKAQAATHLEKDPYNLEYNCLMKKDVSRFERTESGYRISVVERVSLEEEFEYARRILMAAPFDPDNWRDYGALVARSKGKLGFIAADPYRINAIVFSNYSPGRLQGYAFEKLNMLAHFEQLDTEQESERWRQLTEEQRAGAEIMRQEWLAVRDEIDLDETLRCPMMRAYRLHQAICERVKDSGCDLQQEQRSVYEIVRADVNERRACTGVMAAGLDDLFYRPVEVDLSRPEG